MNDLHFPRPELAHRIASDLVGASLLSDARNGLFLAQARRTGKSWFLQRDLKPALEAKGWIVLYVDLWKDTKRDPASLISDVIETAFEEHLGWMTKATKRMGIEKLGIPGTASVDFANALDFATLTLADALAELHKRSKKKIALLPGARRLRPVAKHPEDAGIEYRMRLQQRPGSRHAACACARVSWHKRTNSSTAARANSLVYR